MTHDTQGKTAIFLVLFLMSLSLHIQFPIFTPYVVSLGATSLFISVLLSTSSLANLFGHVIAGPYIDRIGKKPFIVAPLLFSAFLMVAYGLSQNPFTLFLFRFVNAFVLAFLMPACFALLSSYAKSSREQGKNMAINGLLVTIANIIAPLIGGYLVNYIGFRKSYYLIGILLLISGMIALIFIKEVHALVSHKHSQIQLKELFLDKKLLPIYFTAFALMYAQGTILYEVPLLVVEHNWSTMMTGQLFSLMGIGTLTILMMFWLNYISAFFRTLIGMLFVGICFYQLVIPVFPIGTRGTFLSLGIGFGLLFPALTTLITEKVDKAQHGKAFGILSAIFSLGMVTSPLIAGLCRQHISPYFITFLVIMISVLLTGFTGFNVTQKEPI